MNINELLLAIYLLVHVLISCILSCLMILNMVGIVYIDPLLFYQAIMFITFQMTLTWQAIKRIKEKPNGNSQGGSANE